MKKITAGQVMTHNVLTASPEWPVNRLVEFLTNHSITGAPVVTETRDLVGVVSLTDVARSGELAERAPAKEVHAYYRHGLERLVAREEMSRFRVDLESATTVRDIMTPMLFAVEEDAAVQDVAEMMITGRIHRVLVKRDGKMVGIITSLDLLPLVRDM